MGEKERSGCTTPADEPAPADKVSEAPARPDEPILFARGRGPRLFGEGSYSSGGSPEEGNYTSPDDNPQGGYGSFDDAGGYGATELLGSHTEHERRTEDERKKT